MAEFDIFNAPKTKVVKGVEGKSLLIHSDSVKCGKTTVGSQMPKPFYLRFEQGANAIDGLDYAPLTSWSDFKKVNRQLTNPKTVEQARAKYTTLIFDTVDIAIKWCGKYICSKYGVERLKEGNSGYGLWTEYADEWFNEINALLNAGYFLYFISHSEPKKQVDGITGEEYEQLNPKGDKRTIDLVVEACDLIGYVKSNGVNEDGSIIKSSCYFAETKEYKAGTRFEHMPRVLKEFSAKSLQDAIKLAVELKEKETGNKSVTFDEHKIEEAKEKKEYTLEEIVAEIKPLVKSLWKKPNIEEIKDIFSRNLGIEVSELDNMTSKQMPQLEITLFELKELGSDIK